jgi:hypothetical protein
VNPGLVRIVELAELEVNRPRHLVDVTRHQVSLVEEVPSSELLAVTAAVTATSRRSSRISTLAMPKTRRARAASRGRSPRSACPSSNDAQNTAPLTCSAERSPAPRRRGTADVADQPFRADRTALVP